jgi:hypothetical protein
MKKLLITLGLIFSINAHAESWVMPNEGGGEITLTSEACMADGGKYASKLKKAYSWTNRIYFDGCWGVVDGNVHVIWMLPSGERARNVYNINSFTRRI